MRRNPKESRAPPGATGFAMVALHDLHVRPVCPELLGANKFWTVVSLVSTGALANPAASPDVRQRLRRNRQSVGDDRHHQWSGPRRWRQPHPFQAQHGPRFWTRLWRRSSRRGCGHRHQTDVPTRPPSCIKPVMQVEWNHEDHILKLDGEEYAADDADGPIDVRVAVLRRLKGTELPEHVKVRAVRKVAGSFRDVYGDPDNAYFERTPAGGLVVVDDAFVADVDDEPNPERRVGSLRRDIAEAVAILGVAQECGAVASFDVSKTYDDELAYLHFTVPVHDVDRPIYEIIHSVPSYTSLLPARTPGAVLGALRAVSQAGPTESHLVETVRHLVRALGHRPDDIKMGRGTSSTPDAVLAPYEMFRPLITFEVKSHGATSAAVAAAEHAAQSVGSAATVLLSPDVIWAKTADGEIRLDPAEATWAEAGLLLGLLGPDALPLAPKPTAAEHRLPIVALTEALAAAEAAETNDDKGSTYEDLACLALDLLPAVRVKYRRLRSDTAEIDIVAEYDGAPRIPLFEETGRYFVGECKNWAKPAAAKDLRDFFGKMRGCQAKLGIYFARNGVTGRADSDAVGVIKMNFQSDGLIVVVITHEDLKAVAAGESLLHLIDRRCDAVRFQFV